MTNLPVISSKRKQKHLSKKNRSKHRKYSIRLQIPLDNEHQQIHELLSDWESAS